MKILAIDPGFERVGVAVLEHDPTRKEKDTVVYSTCFKTKATLPFYERLLAIGTMIEEVIQLYTPSALAIEKLYLSTNQKTVMGVAEARGVIIYCAARNNLSLFEYTPPQIKVAVTGYGKADKAMVMSMIPKLIQLKTITKSDDELDAIAIGLTCLACERFSTHSVLLQTK